MKIPYPEDMVPLEPIPTGIEPGGRPKQPVQCLMFDIYGTLFISGSGDVGTEKSSTSRFDRLQRILSDFDLTVTSDALIESFVDQIEEAHRDKRSRGVDVPEVEYDRIWKALLPDRDDTTVRRFAVAVEMVLNPVYPMPQLAELIAGCRKKDLPMGVISNAQFFTPLLFDWFLGKRPEELGFDPGLLFYSYRLGVAKPSPRLFHAAVSALSSRGIPPNAVLFVGNDMLNDILAAGRAGFQTALFAGDARSLRLRDDHPECRDVHPDLMITDLAQLLDVV